MKRISKRLCMLCAIALMGGTMALAQDQTPQTPADNTARTEQYNNHRDRGGNWGWLGLLGLIGLAGLRRGGERVNRTYYDDSRRDEGTGRRVA